MLAKWIVVADSAGGSQTCPQHWGYPGVHFDGGRRLPLDLGYRIIISVGILVEIIELFVVGFLIGLIGEAHYAKCVRICVPFGLWHDTCE